MRRRCAGEQKALGRMSQVGEGVTSFKITGMFSGETQSNESIIARFNHKGGHQWITKADRNKEKMILENDKSRFLDEPQYPC
jgi:hypothetical protein